jgi:hypothetical protein
VVTPSELASFTPTAITIMATTINQIVQDLTMSSAVSLKVAPTHMENVMIFVRTNAANLG